MSYILGISAFYHDSSVALIKDGKIISAVQEERFTRVKHDSSFPKESIKYILENSDIKLSEINSIVFYEKPFLKFERLLETYIAFAPKGFRSFAASMPIWLREKLFQKDMIFKELKNIDQSFDDIKKLKFSEHHMSHAASAYYPSPYDEALVLTLDGVGEWSTTTIGIGKKNKIEILKEIHFPHSLGLLYSAFTYYLGFKVNSGEYKVMGLAPYGTPKYKNIILDNLITVKEDGSFKMNMKYFDFATDLKMTNKKFDDLFGQERRNPEVDLLTEFHMDIASSLQAVTEEIVLKITTKIKEEYKIENLCMSGGVALNCVANGKILKNKVFKNIWIQPASGDAGGSLGAALAYWHNELDNQKLNLKDAMQGSYLGPSYKNNYVEKELNRIGANFQKFKNDELLDLIANELVNEKAIGWFQGRMEFGPRALGARSIIADPRSDKMQKNLNLKVKFRESFRPFAPAVLREKVSDYFNIDQDSPYMLLVSDVNENIKIKMREEDKKLFGIEKLNIKRSSIPAVTHVDYSARIQTVHEETNKKFYDLINKFYEKTNCAVLINTSFNVRGEPIVNTPEDAFRCFMGTDLDLLVIENFILFKERQNKDLLLDYKNQFELD
ncbi:MAG: carbamoyltransferase [Pelagibacteraceae bacterium]|nr:carbamoyltransferase [Pelagibacteraceae bacterium]MCI5078881.1 carbamoyltransferase [Pelagibacteraceae bacterium]